MDYKYTRNMLIRGALNSFATLTIVGWQPKDVGTEACTTHDYQRDARDLASFLVDVMPASMLDHLGEELRKERARVEANWGLGKMTVGGLSDGG